MADSSGGSALPSDVGVAWRLRIGGSTTIWDWSLGRPELRTLEPLRRPASGAASKHVPVRAYSQTVRTHLMLESGLEHDLVRVLDHDADVTWIVPQPLQLEWGIGRSRKHVPDLLAVGPDDSVTVWDVKTVTAADSANFDTARRVTEQACDSVGWKYEVFTGLPDVHRHNLLWLHAYRSRPTWADRWEAELLAAAHDGSPLGDLVGRDPERTSLTWHLIWSGRLSVDLTRRLSPTTRVAS